MMFEWDERLILRLLLLVSFNSDKEHIPPQACTPKPLGGDSVSLKKHQTARKIASLLRNPSALRPKGSHQKSVLMIRETSVKKNIAAAAATTNLIQDNQAIKRQKLDDGRSRQVSLLFFFNISKLKLHISNALLFWSLVCLRFSIQNQRLCFIRQDKEVSLTPVSTYVLKSLSKLRRRTERYEFSDFIGYFYKFSDRRWLLTFVFTFKGLRPWES